MNLQINLIDKSDFKYEESNDTQAINDFSLSLFCFLSVDNKYKTFNTKNMNFLFASFLTNRNQFPVFFERKIGSCNINKCFNSLLK